MAEGTVGGASERLFVGKGEGSAGDTFRAVRLLCVMLSGRNHDIIHLSKINRT